MTAETLALFAGVLLSLAASYIPGWADWYAAQTPINKRLVMLAMLLVTSVGILAGNCLGYGADIGYVYTCDAAGGVELFRVFVAALIANQATYTASPKRLPAKTIDYEE